MLFKPGSDKKPGSRVATAVARRIVSIVITLIILGGLGYFGWVAEPTNWKKAACGWNNETSAEL